VPPESPAAAAAALGPEAEGSEAVGSGPEAEGSVVADRLRRQPHNCLRSQSEYDQSSDNR
jgi:hypothetical protein